MMIKDLIEDSTMAYLNSCSIAMKEARNSNFTAKAAMKMEYEQKLINEIAAVTSLEFAKQAADILDSRKQWYSFEAYLILLENLIELLCAGMPGSLAIESLQCGYDADTILAMWRLATI